MYGVKYDHKVSIHLGKDFKKDMNFKVFVVKGKFTLDNIKQPMIGHNQESSNYATIKNH